MTLTFCIYIRNHAQIKKFRVYIIRMLFLQSPIINIKNRDLISSSSVDFNFKISWITPDDLLRHRSLMLEDDSFTHSSAKSKQIFVLNIAILTIGFVWKMEYLWTTGRCLEVKTNIQKWFFSLSLFISTTIFLCYHFLNLLYNFPTWKVWKITSPLLVVNWFH